MNLKKKSSIGSSFHSEIAEQPANLFTQAMKAGPQKFLNRQEALDRAGVKPISGVAANKPQDMNSIVMNASLGGFFNKASMSMVAPASKEELMKDKHAKDKVALQENSLVAFAMSE